MLRPLVCSPEKLLEEATARGYGLNELLRHEWSGAEVSDLYQIIGYSVGGFQSREEVSDREAEAAGELAAQAVARGRRPRKDRHVLR